MSDVGQPFYYTVEWWGGVVVAGIAINIFAYYLKTHVLDKLFSKFSDAYRKKQETKNKNREENIVNMMVDERKLILNSINSTRKTLSSFAVMILSFLLLILASLIQIEESGHPLNSIPYLLGGALCSILAILVGLGGWRLLSAVDEALARTESSLEESKQDAV